MSSSSSSIWPHESLPTLPGHNAARQDGKEFVDEIKEYSGIYVQDKFPLEAIEAIGKAVGAERTAYSISPWKADKIKVQNLPTFASSLVFSANLAVKQRFVSNPDLVFRLQKDAPLSLYKRKSFRLA
ncbi:hypothetical protein EDD85DRAFT_798209 [Armillaria nabsnona]|nr:hypothetical protein EDD85DRAFT_798209 [Armillaria nabsnona]